MLLALLWLEDGYLYDTELRPFADKFGFDGSQSEWVWNPEIESSRATRYFWLNIVNGVAMHSNQSKPIVACWHAHVTRTEVEESQLLPLLSVLLSGFGKGSHICVINCNHNYNVMYVVCQCAVSLPQEYQSLCNEYRCSPMQACALAFFLTNPHPRTRYCCEAVRLWISNLDIVLKKLTWPDWLRIYWLSTVTMVFRTYKSGEIYKPTKEHLDDPGWSSAPHHTLNIDSCK